MTRKILHKIWDIVSYFLAFILIIAGTLFTYFYANGYRFNPINGSVKQTGVLNVETLPSKAQIFINSSDSGRSPKVSSVDIGFAYVKITKDGYVSWEKNVPILAEKSTTITPTLYLENPQPESVYSIKGKVIKQEIDQKNNKLIALVLAEDKYKLIVFETSKRFWNLSDNPSIIYSLESKGIKNITTSLSPDGSWIMITKVLDTKGKSFDFVKLSLPHQVIQNEELTDFAKDYDIKWSNDSNYLTLESTTDIISYRFTDDTKYLLLKKAAKTKYVWSTDSDGFFYYSNSEKTKDVTRVSLIQTTLHGGNKKTILKDIYFQNSAEKINQIRSENTLSFDPLTNTKDNMNFSGELVSFNVIPNSNGVFLVTTNATYWFNQEDSTYILVTPQATKLVSVSPDNNKILFYNDVTKSYGVFTFKKVEADPLTSLGTVAILENTQATNLKWLSNSEDIIYKLNDEVLKIEYDKTNNHKLIASSGECNFSNDLQYLYTFSSTKENDNLEIIRYKMY